MVLAQRFVDTGGVDLKLYVAPGAVWAVRRESPLARVSGDGERVPVTEDLRALARACGDAFRLALYGVDVLETPSGPVVIDVNEFPNYTGIEEAPETIGRFALDLAASRGVSAEVRA
jgi:glutathione synthase/RimK-type ligase-like ATP-grasp enzyme